MRVKINLSTKNLKNDIFSGLIVALVSIPISMGYAQIAGLPPVYGLYGSLLPIFVYAFFASSPQFVVGVDAMPAAMVGSSLSLYGITAGSPEALEVVPAITLLVAVWLFVLRIIKAGRALKYISDSVLGGFISGVGATIIMMQLPKLWGGNAGTGEILQLIPHIIQEFSNFNLISLILGLGTVIIIQLFKRFFPKFPMTVVMLLVGFLLSFVFKLENYGVKMLPSIEGGLPAFILPNLKCLKDNLLEYAILSLTIALVIMAQTLLAANSYASKYDYELNNNRELTAYGMMNIAGAVIGSCPINGSVSRSGIADQFGCKSQVMSITAAISMLLILLFCTKFFCYLPVPVLTGIVVCALHGIINYKQAKRLFKLNKSEFSIFVFAAIGVLFLGTIYGVVIGVLLSFIAVVQKAVVPPRAFLGRIPGQHGYYNLSRNKNAKSIKNTIIYRFGGNLFFANIGTFISDIENSIKPETRYVIVDAGGIGDIDITAADKIKALAQKLEKRNILFYLTEHQGHLNDLLRKYGAEKFIENGRVRRTMSLALRSCGIKKPYPLEGVESDLETGYLESEDRLAEFEWAFGEEAEEKMAKLADEMVSNLTEKLASASLEEINEFNIEQMEEKISWGKIGLFDEEQLLENFVIKLENLFADGKINKEQIKKLEKLIEQRRKVIEEKVSLINPKAIEMLHSRIKLVDESIHTKREKNILRLKTLKNRIKNEINKTKKN
ncbi:MAG: SulP family inorganic anion transporter [Treponema sp.]|nr:SulP family inorganic anion transporter [Treponema sp.]